MEMGTCRKKIKLNKDNRGVTMIETMISFVVLFIVLAALYAIVSFSTELYLQSVDASRLQQEFSKEIYKKKENIDPSFVTVREYSLDKNVVNYAGRPSIILSFDAEKTSADNYGNNPAMLNSYISMKYIGATTYVCTEEETAENKIMPKAIEFHYDR